MRRTRTPSGSRYNKRRTTARPSGSFKRGFKARLSRSLWNPNRPYFFKRMANYSDLNFGTLGQGGVITFSLDKLPSYSEFANLFDQYRINKVVVKFVPQVNQVMTGTAAASAIVPVIYTAIDTDGQNTPTSGTDIQQYATCREVSANKPFKRVLVPRCAAPVYQGGVSSGYLECPARQWLDVNYVSVTHYGLIYYANPAVAVGQFSYRIDVIYYIACKSTR